MAYHFFLDVNGLNIQNVGAFGPAGSNVLNSSTYDQFLVTSKHSSSVDVNAIAVGKGQIFVQQQKGEDGLLNIVLKPIDSLPFSFPKIKYFIYKGIKKDSLLSSDNITVSSDQSNDLVSSIWKAFSKFNNTGAPSKHILGLHDVINNLSDDTPIEEVFLSNIEDVQFWNVEAGSTIGKFDGPNIGFEIVLDRLFVIPNLSLVRHSEIYVNVRTLENQATQSDIFRHWHDKETVLGFMDPCAFFLGFYDYPLIIVDNGERTNLKGADLYNIISTLFLNKNKCYFDIRNEFGFSLNYFKNYGNSSLDNNTTIQISKDMGVQFQSVNYYESGWPLLIIDGTEFTSAPSSYQSIFLKFPSGNEDNMEPLVYFEVAFDPMAFPSKYDKQFKFRNLSVIDGYSDQFGIALPKKNSNLISTYTLLRYNRRSNEESLSQLSCQIKKSEYLDALFPLKMGDFNQSVFQTKVFEESIYLNLFKTHIFEGAFSLAISVDSDNVTVFAVPTNINTTESHRRPLVISGDFRSQDNSSFLEKIAKEQQSSELTKTSLVLSEDELDLIEFKTSIVDIQAKFDAPDLRKIIGFIISKVQWAYLINLKETIYLPEYPVYISVSSIEHLNDDREIAYTSLILALKGMVLNDNQIVVQKVGTDIKLLAYGTV